MDGRADHGSPPPSVRLRDVQEADLPIFFEHQNDPVANEMAAFPARDLQAFTQHWRVNILGDDAGWKQTILLDGEVVGNILSWRMSGETLVGYWIGRAYWGKGVASRALALFLIEVDERPIHAHVARHNRASIRVLEKAGFVIVGEAAIEEAGDEIQEVVMRLDQT
jgi:RimJ/RimL family protein N-acetyltransferase